MSTSQGLSAAKPGGGGLIRPPGMRTTIFGDAAHGDVRRSAEAVARFHAAGAPERIAYANQVHGASVLEVSEPGLAGDGDALVTTTPGLAVAVATADCVPVVVEGPGFVSVIHAGWRGAAQGVVSATMRFLVEAGLTAQRAAIGPAIGPCCYEVGDEVAAALPDQVAETDWGTTSVDLAAAASAQLGQLPVWRSTACTRTTPALYSHRRNRTDGRQVTLAWLPSS